MRYRVLSVGIISLLLCQAAWAQFPRGIKDRVEGMAGKFKDIEITDAEEVRLGEGISSRIRQKYGVVQDPEIHKYVSLVGMVVVKKGSRSNLPFRFIVLDTDGVNAFAAPGGFIHITRGALSLMKSEAELAGVLGHEIAHVTEKHTIRAIQKGKVVQMAANEKSVSANPALFRRLADEAFKVVFAGFGRTDELDADEHGIVVTTGAGYASNGLSRFLTVLKERNTNSQAKQGLFASHPETDERLQKIDALIKSRNLTSDVVLTERFVKHIKYQPVELTKIAVIKEGAAGLADGKKEGEEKKEGEDESGKKKSRFSLSKLRNPLGSGGSTTQSAEVTGSGGSRAVDKERAAKGGSNPTPVAVAITDKELEDFKKEGKLKG